MAQIAKVEDSATANRQHKAVHDVRSIPAVRVQFLRNRQNYIHSVACSEYRLASS